MHSIRGDNYFFYNHYDNYFFYNHYDNYFFYNHYDNYFFHNNYDNYFFHNNYYLDNNLNYLGAYYCGRAMQFSLSVPVRPYL